MLQWLYSLVMSVLTWVMSFFGGSFNKSNGGGQEELKQEQEPNQYSESAVSSELSKPPVLLP
jgi:hypothetical protein